MPSRRDQSEDANRLPEGIERIGYDSDTMRYIFRDRSGGLYEGEPGTEYGALMPIPPTNTATETTRPSAFASASVKPVRRSTIDTPRTVSSIRTFQDILPPELITTSSLSESAYNPRSSGHDQRGKLKEAVRKSALPKMQGVVHSLRRSVTSIRKPLPSRSKFVPLEDCDDNDTTHLAHDDFPKPSITTLGFDKSSVSSSRMDISQNAWKTSNPSVAATKS